MAKTIYRKNNIRIIDLNLRYDSIFPFYWIIDHNKINLPLLLKSIVFNVTNIISFLQHSAEMEKMKISSSFPFVP